MLNMTCFAMGREKLSDQNRLARPQRPPKPTEQGLAAVA